MDAMLDLHPQAESFLREHTRGQFPAFKSAVCQGLGSGFLPAVRHLRQKASGVAATNADLAFKFTVSDDWLVFVTAYLTDPTNGARPLFAVNPGATRVWPVREDRIAFNLDLDGALGSTQALFERCRHAAAQRAQELVANGFPRKFRISFHLIADALGYIDRETPPIIGTVRKLSPWEYIEDGEPTIILADQDLWIADAIVALDEDAPAEPPRENTR